MTAADASWLGGSTGSTIPLKHLAKLVNGCAFKPDDWSDGGLPIIRIENLNGSESFNRTERVVESRYRVARGDLLFGWSGNRGTSFGPFIWDPPRITEEKEQWLLNQHIFRLDDLRCDRRWLYWALRAATRFIEEQTSGIIGMVHVTKDELGSVHLPAVNESQQVAVAEFLDRETARIDALIGGKRRMISALDERIDSLVMSWVGRSELAGAGQVPLVPIRRRLLKVERWTEGEGEMVTAFRDGQVTTRSSRGRDGFTNAWTDGARYQVVDAGNVVIHGLDGFSGAIGDAELAGVCSPIYHVCVPKQGDSAFYGRLLRLLATSGYLGNFASSTRERAVDFRNWDLFGRIPIPDVPVDEQARIGELIRSARPLRKVVDESRVLAAERRQALITAAVTGELEVAA